jgi:hypothetical protein
MMRNRASNDNLTLVNYLIQHGANVNAACSTTGVYSLLGVCTKE